MRSRMFLVASLWLFLLPPLAHADLIGGALRFQGFTVGPFGSIIAPFGSFSVIGDDGFTAVGSFDIDAPLFNPANLFPLSPGESAVLAGTAVVRNGVANGQPIGEIFPARSASFEVTTDPKLFVMPALGPSFIFTVPFSVTFSGGSGLVEHGGGEAMFTVEPAPQPVGGTLWRINEAQYAITPVPEASTLLLTGTALVLLGAGTRAGLRSARRGRCVKD